MLKFALFCFERNNILLVQDVVWCFRVCFNDYTRFSSLKTFFSFFFFFKHFEYGIALSAICLNYNAFRRRFKSCNILFFRLTLRFNKKIFNFWLGIEKLAFFNWNLKVSFLLFILKRYYRGSLLGFWLVVKRLFWTSDFIKRRRIGFSNASFEYELYLHFDVVLRHFRLNFRILRRSTRYEFDLFFQSLLLCKFCQINVVMFWRLGQLLLFLGCWELR